jgi:hypothetical protein
MKTTFKTKILTGFFVLGLSNFNSCARDQQDPQIARYAGIPDVTEILPFI